ncbi:MAG: head-tail adaptor protein [Actinotignum sanguinis]|uniref:head-tail adaptor protein n=1 Tax=Actinomycetaceae TaxID=2049 RepID=UPI00254B848B|nr:MULTISPECIES: head-tail adaptor protein [Actinomycetaceae]MDK8319950.1 head-tail adaptor protein [Actinobaculum massiliense]MDK8609197.1 head-tail adaptor protein [Actinomycetaceae bacterium UMB8041A]MDK8802313.1 head-tail adaptor protein [Actinotignum sanguinis]
MASLGSMRTTIDLIIPVVVRDKAGFTTTRDEVQATVRVQVEVRHASAAWVNRAAYSQADVLFRIRTIPGLSVTTDMEISGPGGRYVIDAVEVIGRYVEILAHQTTPEGEPRG